MREAAERTPGGALAHVSQEAGPAQPPGATGAIAARGLGKVYETFPDPNAEAAGLFLWLGNLRRALRLTTERPRRVAALDGVDLDVAPGEVLGLMGHNGAGKTTLIKILCGLVTPSAGSVRVNGFDVVHERDAVKRSVSYVSTTGWMGLEWALTVEENLGLYAHLFGLRGAAARDRVREALAAVGLAEQAARHVYQLSSGMRQRAVIARGLLVHTPVLFLDEPTVGLDPVTARDLRELVSAELNGRLRQTIVITSHFAPELEALCDRVGVLAHGRLLALAPPAELVARLGERVVAELRIGGLTDAAAEAVRGQPGVLEAVATVLDADGSARLRVHLATADALDGVLDALTAGGAAVRGLITGPPTLEDAYLAIAGGALT